MYILIIGNNVKKSFSPIIYNNFYKKCNIKYFKLSIKKKFIFNGLINFFSYKKKLFFNLTIPYKEITSKFSNFCSNRVLKINANNIFVKYKNTIFSYTTDGLGFFLSLKKNILLKKKNILILGAGGSCKSIMDYIKNKYKYIYIFNRGYKNINIFNRLFLKKFKKISYENLKNFKNFLIINTIPYYPFLFNYYNLLNKKNFFYLINYRIKNILFDGSNMLFEQAIENIKIFKNENERKKIEKKFIKIS
ncbi:hypothetical protein ACWNYQ_00630 [Candidatus Vidania fulgoroideorum]